MRRLKARLVSNQWGSLWKSTTKVPSKHGNSEAFLGDARAALYSIEKNEEAAWLTLLGNGNRRTVRGDSARCGSDGRGSNRRSRGQPSRRNAGDRTRDGRPRGNGCNVGGRTVLVSRGRGVLNRGGSKGQTQGLGQGRYAYAADLLLGYGYRRGGNHTSALGLDRGRPQSPRGQHAGTVNGGDAGETGTPGDLRCNVSRGVIAVGSSGGVLLGHSRLNRRVGGRDLQGGYRGSIREELPAARDYQQDRQCHCDQGDGP